MFWVIVFILFTIFLAISSFLIFSFFARKKELEKRRWTTFLVRVPRDNEYSFETAFKFFNILHGIFNKKYDSVFSRKNQPEFSFEVLSRSREILVFFSIVSDYSDFLQTQLLGLYPNMELTISDEIEKLSGKFFVSTLNLKNQDFLPIRVSANFSEQDPMSVISNSIFSSEENISNGIQIILKPSSGKKIREKAEKYFQISKNPESQEEKSNELEDNLKSSAKEKLSSAIFLSEVRCFSNFSKEKSISIARTFFQFNNPPINSLEIKNFKKDSKVIISRKTLSKRNYFNSQEIASMCHPPTSLVKIPGVRWLESARREPPKAVPTLKNTKKEDISIFGTLNYKDRKEKYGIHTKDRERHLYIIGKSGTGKSTLIKNLVIDDIRNGKGVALIDPHGDSVEEVLNFIPSNRINDVIYINPFDRERPIQINMFETKDESKIPLIASSVVGVFHKLYGYSWGPRLEYILRNAALALLYYPEKTSLSDLPPLLTNKNFQEKILSKVKDEVIVRYFHEEYDKLSEKERGEQIASVLNKVGQFISNPVIRNMMGTKESSFDFREAMDSEKIILANLSVGVLGEDVSTLVGAVLITKIQLAGMSRADTPEIERKNFFLFVDEFQTFATESFVNILSEARKYKLCLTMANQYLDQLPPELQSGIFGNVGSMIVFRVGAKDAEVLSKEMAGVFSPNDLIGLSNYEVAVKMTIQNEDYPAFSGKTLPLPEFLRNKNKEKIIRASREKFGKKV